jgi:predicted transcriptional regulator
MVTRSNALSIYIPKSKAHHRPLERLTKLAAKKDRSMNYLIVDAILQYLDRREAEVSD